jgi:hypothetical protein
VIAAHDQPLAREHLGSGDFGEIAVIEQRQLQRPVVGRQRLNGRRPQAGDPVQAVGLEIVADARGGDHAAIADHRHATDAEAVLEPFDLSAQRRGIGRIAVEHFDGDRNPASRAQQPVDDLGPVLAVIAAVAKLRQRAAAALKVRGTHVVKNQHPILEVPARQAVLDPRLALNQPIERLISFALLHLAQTQNRAQARDRRRLVHRPHKAELGARRDQPVHDHRHHQIAAAPRRLILRRTQDQPVQRDLSQHSKRRRNMAVGQRTLDLDRVRSGADHRAALEQRLQTFKQIRRKLAQIGQRPLVRAALLVAPALPQQDRRRRTPIGNRFHEHSRIESHPDRFGNPHMDTK